MAVKFFQYSPSPPEPSEVTAGDSITWSRDCAGYSASDGWQLKYALRNADGKIDITAAGIGETYTVTVSPTDSAGYLEGLYQFQAYLTDGTDRITVATGKMRILPNLAAQEEYDARSYNRKCLDMIKEVLADPSALKVQSYQIGGRSLANRSVMELERLEQKFQYAVAREEGKAPDHYAANFGRST